MGVAAQMSYVGAMQSILSQFTEGNTESVPECGTSALPGTLSWRGISCGLTMVIRSERWSRALCPSSISHLLSPSAT